MSWDYGSNVFSGATVASLSESGANADDNVILNNTDYWESDDPADLSEATSGVTASSVDTTYVATRAFDGNTATNWKGTSATNEWLTNRLYTADKILVNQISIHNTTDGSNRRNKLFTLYGTNSDLAGGDAGWTSIGSDTATNVVNEQVFDITNFTRYSRYKILFADSYTTVIGTDEIKLMCATPWITITPTTATVIKKVTVKLHEVDNAGVVRIYGVDASDDWTLLTTGTLANVATAQDFIIGNNTAYPTYAFVFSDFRGGATHAKVDFIGGYGVEETEQTEAVTGVDSGTSYGNFFFDNLLYRADPTVTVTSEETGYEKEYLYDKNQGSTWRSTDLTDQTLKFELDAAYNNHGVAVLNHNLDASLDTVYVEYSDDDFTTVAVAGTLTINDDVAYFISLAPLTYDYVRLRITTTGAVRSYFEIGQVFVAGGFYDFERKYDHGDEWGKEFGKALKQSSSGIIYGNPTRYDKRIQSAQFSYIGTDQRLNFEAAAKRGWVVYSPSGSSGPVWFGVTEFSGFLDQKSNTWYGTMTFTESPA